jgi:hypothetical protein
LLNRYNAVKKEWVDMTNKIVVFYFMVLAFMTHNAYAKDINLTGIYKNEPCNISIEIAKNTYRRVFKIRVSCI